MAKLHDLAERGDLEGVRRLLDDGAPVDEPGMLDESPLYVAAAEGHIELVMLLLERGASVEGVDRDEFRTPLMAASAGGHVEVARLLLDHGADACATNDYGDPVLSYAAWGGEVALIRLLLDRGADPAVRNELDQLPHEEALERGHLAAADLLAAAFAGRRARS